MEALLGSEGFGAGAVEATMILSSRERPAGGPTCAAISGTVTNSPCRSTSYAGGSDSDFTSTTSARLPAPSGAREQA
jgi:hypothetical protein